eukprot:91670_1
MFLASHSLSEFLFRMKIFLIIFPSIIFMVGAAEVTSELPSPPQSSVTEFVTTTNINSTESHMVQPPATTQFHTIEPTAFEFTDNIVFISKNGTDHQSCGYATDPCGTLYHVSKTFLTSSHDDYSVYVIDGQNKAQIIQHKENNIDNYDPCLPIDIRSRTNITFNPNKVSDLDDWYPRDVCMASNFVGYQNQYMFGYDSGNSGQFIINNLIVNNYHGSYGIVKMTSPYINIFSCTDCAFSNIKWVNYATLFSVSASIQLLRNAFINISTQANVIGVNWRGFEHKSYSMIMKDTIFSNVETSQSILYISNTKRTYLPPPDQHVSVINCNFSNISAKLSIIHDNSYTSATLISDSIIDINDGAIYYSQHGFNAIINTSNISISVVSDILSGESNVDGLLYFNEYDTVYLNNIDIGYVYDTNVSCDHEYTYVPSWLGGTKVYQICKDTVTAIYNLGDMKIYQLNVHADIFNDFSESAPLVYTTKSSLFGASNQDVLDFGLIKNLGEMTVINANVRECICRFLFTNIGTLYIFDLQVGFLNQSIINPIHIIIQQIPDKSPSLFIHQAYLLGTSSTLLRLRSGTAEISNCVLVDNKMVIDARFLNQLTLKNSTMISEKQATGLHSTIFVFFCNNVVLKELVFSGYHFRGFLNVDESKNIILTKNTFSLDIRYWKDEGVVGFWENPLSITRSSDISIIGNYFGNNDADPGIPWLYMKENNGLNCMTGNVFNGFAFHVFNTNITSCFIPLLSDSLTEYMHMEQCIYNENLPVDKSLVNLMNNDFIVDTANKIPSIFTVESGEVALYNAQIFVNNTNENYEDYNPIVISLYNGSLLLLDSVVTSSDDSEYDISCRSANCTVICNERLINKANIISKLLMYGSYAIPRWKETSWNDYNDYYITMSDFYNHTDDEIYPPNLFAEEKKSMTLLDPQFVQYLLPIKFTMATVSQSYYPGQRLELNYDIFDVLNNFVNFSEHINVILTGNTFFTQVEIDEKGACEFCKKGILIDVLTIKKNLTQTYDIDVFIDIDTLVPIPPKLSVVIIGCPIGYEPDENNISCTKCNNGYYNLLDENVNECISCDEDDNKGIKCIDGDIYIQFGHWMGFDGDKIISGVCPSDYCCVKADGCNYIDDNEYLCIANRDPNSILCGRCIDDYSESMNSSKCSECTKGFYGLYLLYPFSFAILWSVYLILSASEEHKTKETDKKEKRGKCGVFNKCKSSIKKFRANNKTIIDMTQVFIQKNISYYQQALSQILTSNSYSVLFGVIAKGFELSFITSRANDDTDSELWCFYHGMNGKEKILMDLLTPGIIIFVIITINIFVKLVFKNEFVLFGKKVNFEKLYVDTLLLIVGNIVAVLFRLLDCQQVGEHAHHFYYGYEKCYSITWWLSLSALLTIIGSMSVIFIKLKQMNYEERNKEDNFLNKFVSKYKPEYYYWEYLLFIRRMSISMFTISVNSDMAQIIFIAVMLVFISLQKNCEPFAFADANSMEYFLLQLLIIVIALNLSTSIDTTFNNVVLSGFIIFPFMLMAYYIVGFIKKNTKNVYAAADDGDEEIEMMTTSNLGGSSVLSVRTNSTYHEDEFHVNNNETNELSTLIIGKETVNNAEEKPNYVD